MAHADVIVENGTIVTEGGSFGADLVIADERIAALTLAGTGITTYIWPVSVTVVVMSRTTAPFFFSVILPA